MSTDASETRKDDLRAELHELTTTIEAGQRRSLFSWATGRGRSASNIEARESHIGTSVTLLPAGSGADSDAQEFVSEDELRTELAALKALVLAQRRRGLLGWMGWLAHSTVERQARFRQAFKATVLGLTPPDSELTQEQHSTLLGRVSVALRRRWWVKVLAPIAVLAIFGLWWVVIVKIAGF